jgi:periplasmic divalent cation tolerance protein
MTTDVRVVLVTASSEEQGAQLARTLLDERLCACVNILPGMRSLYRWQGKIEDAREVLLLVKTSADRIGALFARLRVVHPYENPEAIALVVDRGLPAYLEWILAETHGAA